MASWKVTMAIGLASVLLAGPTFAQSTQKSDSAGQMPKASDSSSGTMKSETGTKSDTGMKASDSGMKSSAAKGGMAMAGDERVKAAQQALKDKGHDPGDVDGKMGPKTQAALRDFQKAQGLQASGRLDAKTVQALGIEAGKTSSADKSTTGGSASPGAGTSSTDTSKSGESAAKDAGGAKK
jgi:peptidoglycan hydrolase-like protein with peptidoglycan-binding domain